jgi:hypothetical protein
MSIHFYRRFRGTCCLHHQGNEIALMMEAASTSQTSVNFYQTTRRYNPEDSHLHTRRRENIRSYLANLYGEATLPHRPDDGSSKHLLNVGKLPDYTALQPRRQPSSYSPP